MPKELQAQETDSPVQDTAALDTSGPGRQDAQSLLGTEKFTDNKFRKALGKEERPHDSGWTPK